MPGIFYSGISLDISTFIILRKPARRKAAKRYHQFRSTRKRKPNRRTSIMSFELFNLLPSVLSNFKSWVF
jgi:hypothetical protein